MQTIIEQIVLHIRAMWRYRWYAMAAAWILVCLGWVVVFRTPTIYTAKANIYVDTSTVLKPLLKGLAVEKNNTEYIRVVTRELVSRPNLKEVASIVGLDQQAKTPRQLDAVLTSLERSVRVQRKKVGREYTDFFIITYSNKNPQHAEQVVGALIDLFSEKTIAEGLRDSKAANEFVARQVQAQQELLIASELRISNFKREHVNELPSEGVSYFDSLQKVQSELDKIDSEIAETRYKRSNLKQQLASVPAEKRATSSDGKFVLTPMQSRLHELQAQLSELRLKFTERHPTIVTTKRKIAELEKQPQINQYPVMPNPVYQQLEAAIGQIDTELAALTIRRNRTLQQIQQLQKQTKRLTEVELQLKRLNQEYDIIKKRYDVLVARQESADISGNVEQSGENLKFKIIDPPRITNDPSRIKRKYFLMTGGVLAAGIAGGLGLAFLLAQFWPTILGVRALSELSEYPVIGLISRAPTLQSRLYKTFDFVAFGSIGILMLLAHGFAVFIGLKNSEDLIHFLEHLV